VEIEEHCIAGLWAFDAFAGNAAKVEGRNFYRGWNPVGVGVKNPPGDAIVAHALQTALDTPFYDPHRKPRLKTDLHAPPPFLEL
jgi:hypothetical protein